ncbi:MAG: hypothetical protein HC933_10210 [Pleurocapsa sp. SU_196_0]|nr:hypothetical protein [Pleurocapsa sp. SU_196_0]
MLHGHDDRLGTRLGALECCATFSRRASNAVNLKDAVANTSVVGSGVRTRLHEANGERLIIKRGQQTETASSTARADRFGSFFDPRIHCPQSKVRITDRVDTFGENLLSYGREAGIGATAFEGGLGLGRPAHQIDVVRVDVPLVDDATHLESKRFSR